MAPPLGTLLIQVGRTRRTATAQVPPSTSLGRLPGTTELIARVAVPS